MAKPHESFPAPAHKRNRWRYPLLFGMQTIGAGILIWTVIPYYRGAFADPASYYARPEILVWILAGIVLIQGGYWIRYRVHPSMPQFANLLLGHLVQFVARMGFVLASSIFGFVFIIRPPEFHMPTSRYVVLVLGLFSLFCYALELERLARTLNRTRESPTASTH